MLKRRTIEIIFSIFLAVFLLVTAFYIPYYDNSFYNNNFRDNGAYDKLGVNETDSIFTDLKTYLDNDYFGYDRMHLLSEFTENEKSHMIDVKRLIDWLCIMYYISIAIIIMLIIYILIQEENLQKFLGNAFLFCGAGMISLMLLIGVVSLIDFSSFWTFFHNVFFPQGNWMFANDSLLITLFPEKFFSNFVMRFITISSIFSIAGIIAGLILRNYHSRS